MAEITMPRLSDTMEEGTIASWLKKPGEKVDRGEVIAQIETDKATMDLTAFEAGTLQEILAPEGSTVAQYWQLLRSRSKMFLRDSARLWCGIRRYSSRRITEGRRMATRAECRKCPFSSSVIATPFNTSTIALRAAQTLMGSYEAFSTSTGACRA